MFDIAAKRALSLRRGLYLVKVAVAGKPVDHYAILDVGHVLARFNDPVRALYQLVPEGPVVVDAVGSMLAVVKQVHDEDAARLRFDEALANPDYALLGNNCEHFARYVA